MSTTAVALCLILMVAVYQFALGTYFFVKRKEIRKRLRVQRTCTTFAEARHVLLQLVRSKELSHNSETFRTLYFLQTFIMRHPDKYEQIADHVLSRLVSARSDGNSLKAESKQWSPAVRRVFEQTGQGVALLLFAYSPLVRVMVRAKRVFGSIPRPFADRAVQLEERQPVVVTFRKAQQKLEEFAGQNHAIAI